MTKLKATCDGTHTDVAKQKRAYKRIKTKKSSENMKNAHDVFKIQEETLEIVVTTDMKTHAKMRRGKQLNIELKWQDLLMNSSLN